MEFMEFHGDGGAVNIKRRRLKQATAKQATTSSSTADTKMPKSVG